MRCIGSPGLAIWTLSPPDWGREFRPSGKVEGLDIDGDIDPDDVDRLPLAAASVLAPTMSKRQTAQKLNNQSQHSPLKYAP